jgi:hypothetical protein
MFEPCKPTHSTVAHAFAAANRACVSCEPEFISGPSDAESSALSLDELGATITELAGHLNAANHRWLMLIAEFDRRKGWADGATQSCAHWLNWKCGLDRGAAREKVRVAHALEHLPLISASMARGALSYSKVRALTRVATPLNEDILLMIAEYGTAHHVEKLVRQYRRAQEAAELDREAQQFAGRRVTYFHDDDGSVVLHVRLTAESGAVLLKALEVATDEFWRADVSAATPVDNFDATGDFDGSGDFDAKGYSKRTTPQRRADALALFAESYLKHGFEALSGGERQQIVVHVDAETLREETLGRCELEDGPSVAAQTARRLACDASVVTILEDEAGQPLDIGRRSRSIPPAIRRALRSRDKACSFPGCTHTRYLDGHHVRHWADGGETKLSNLVMLCRFHHRQVHEGGVKVEILNDGALRFSNDYGKRFEDPMPPHGSGHALVCQHERSGLNIDQETAVTKWCGEPMDYGVTIYNLMARQARAQRVAAETEWPSYPGKFPTFSTPRL